MVKNAKQFPKRYFGLHFAPGVAQYKEPGSEAYKIFLNQDTINRMDPTFEGKPVFVGHRDEVTPATLPEADGVIVRSFFNQADGKQWVEFLVTSDQGHEAISKGWKLSNAYLVKSSAAGGQWHGVEYSKEVMDGEYEHLALVPNPRYAESIILTPTEFKAHNEQKISELKRLTNSGEKKSMFNFFKRAVVENASDFDTMSVTLPKSGVEKTVSALINEADEAEEKKKKPAEEEMANPKHNILFGEKKMSVEKLASAYQDCLNEIETLKKPKEEEEKKENSLPLIEAEAKATLPIKNEATPDPIALGRQLYGSK